MMTSAIATTNSGSACVAPKTTTETRNSVTSPRSTRRSTNPQIPRGRRTRSEEAAIAVTGRGYDLLSSATRAAHRAARPLSRLSAEPDRPVAVAEGVEREHALVALLDALDLGAVAVEERREAPDQVAAVVVLHLLHVVQDLRPLLLVDGAERLLVEGEEPLVGRIRPVRLVVR